MSGIAIVINYHASYIERLTLQSLLSMLNEMLEAVQNHQAKVSIIRWKLREVMARRRISNKALAEAMGLHYTSIGRAKSQDIMPELGGETLAKYIDVINRLSADQYGICSLEELIEYEE